MFICDTKMLRYTVLSVLLVACHVRAQTIDVDESTAEWLNMVELPDKIQNNEDNGNSQPTTKEKDPIENGAQNTILTADTEDKKDLDDSVDSIFSNIDLNASTEKQQQCGWNSPELFSFNPPSQNANLYARYGEFPWMVALMRKSKTKVWVQDDYIGGGSLIHPSVVMTAKHKLLKVTAAQLKCRAGEWDTQTDMEQYEIQERDADRFVSHPDFYITSLYYDVALIFLKQPFELAGAPHIGTACLAPVLPDPDRATCFGMGWGKDLKHEENFHILKKVRLSLVEHNSCEQMLRKNTRLRLNPYFRLHESLTCAGGEGNVDTCEGDGGSSLVCEVVNSGGGRARYAVVGIVAYGLGCGEKDVPGVYVNVPHVYTWVQQQMADNNYTSDTFIY